MIYKNKRTFVYDLFQSIAPRYDRINDWLSLRQHRRWRKRSLKLIGPLVLNTALDFCCGSGDYMTAIRERFGLMVTVIGLDFSPKMLELAKTKIQSTARSTATFLCLADALRTPFQSNSIDLITIGFALRNVEDLHLLFKVAYQILRTGGIFWAGD